MRLELPAAMITVGEDKVIPKGSTHERSKERENPEGPWL